MQAVKKKETCAGSDAFSGARSESHVQQEEAGANQSKRHSMKDAYTEQSKSAAKEMDGMYKFLPNERVI